VRVAAAAACASRRDASTPRRLRRSTLREARRRCARPAPPRLGGRRPRRGCRR
jgi:hypothetical protein